MLISDQFVTACYQVIMFHHYPMPYLVCCGFPLVVPMMLLHLILLPWLLAVRILMLVPLFRPPARLFRIKIMLTVKVLTVVVVVAVVVNEVVAEVAVLIVISSSSDDTVSLSRAQYDKLIQSINLSSGTAPSTSAASPIVASAGPADEEDDWWRT
ncbi:uncharacterized protein LOC131010582 isoform X2 [Salvia miltiorrhiza]|uniref:uncharacterized protein LOC131010582 isoform X2 n=1 Tax=Salvia miltiorrhiza TaxID=226208 RepID=UPI0025ACFCB3|nr:uncharacterized protein LOC131010582 isoform X2 [Salvia miltiorrhiza]